MNANLMTKKIEMSKSEAKEAGKGYAHYKPLPLQNQGGNFHEATHQLQSCRRVSQEYQLPLRAEMEIV